MADDAVQKDGIEEALEADGVFTGIDTVLAYGYARKSVWAEGPHLYRKDGYYYLIHAEMGTEQNHCVVVARSKTVTGPYEYCLANPILTHRHLGKNYPVTCVGHADLVEDSAGNWYLVALGCRPQEGYTLMGRETFLAKVTWEDGWPVVNPGIGHLECENETDVEESGQAIADCAFTGIAIHGKRKLRRPV